MSGLEVDVVSNTVVFSNKHVLLNTIKNKKLPFKIEIQNYSYLEWAINYHRIDEPVMSCEYTIELVKGAEKFSGIIDIDLEIWNTDKAQHSFSFDSQLKKTFKESLILKGNNAVTVTMKDEVIPAHRDIIMSKASEVFAKMFDTDMLEKKNNTVEITDTEPSIFKELLNYTYFREVDTGELDINEWLKVLLAADKYSYSSLVNDCEEHIQCYLTVENVVDCLMIAVQLDSWFFKQKCMEYMGSSIDRVAYTVSYKEKIIKAGRTELLSEIFIKTVERFRAEYDRYFGDSDDY